MAGVLVALAAPAAGQTLSAADREIYGRALDLAARERFADAETAALRARDPLVRDVILWLDQRRSGAEPVGWDALQDFLTRNPEWPDRTRLQIRAEAAMPDGLTEREVLAWFQANPPASTAGFLRLGAAGGVTPTLTAKLLEWWPTARLTSGNEADLFAAFPRVLTVPQVYRRVDALLFEGRAEEARRLIPRLDAGRAAVAAARLALRAGGRGVDRAVAAVPEALTADPGLLYERLRYRRRNGDAAGAIELLRQAPRQVPYGELWWVELHPLARDAVERRDWRTAYTIAAGHRQTSGQPLAEGEWLAGWIALRKQNDPARALAHFEALHRGVSTPISKSRGAYWAGRAAEAAGDRTLASRWYGEAARHTATFYGQLATQRLGRPLAITLAENLADANARSAFEGRPVVRATRILVQLGHAELAKDLVQFLINSADTAAEWDQTITVAQQSGYGNLSVRAAKLAYHETGVLLDDSFPTLPYRFPAEPGRALAHAIIRQESLFDNRAVSSAGARGYMQVMPGTAREVARQLGIGRGTDLYAAETNILIGSSYIQQQLDNYGSYVLALAAYNAGPGRANQWVRENGDPRERGTDVIDWIELIPIYETRNYVQRVMENFHVYQAIFSQQAVTVAVN